MPTPVTDEQMQHMISMGYIVISEYQDPKLGESETLYEFGVIPPESDSEARQLYFAMYREASKYQLVEGKVYRNTQDRRRHRRKRR